MKKKNIRSSGDKSPRWARLDRTMAARRIEKDMGALYTILGDEVDFGLQTLLTCSRECPQKESRIVGLLLYHHYLEHQDAADLLVRAGAFGAANAQARACVEAALQLIYMVKKNDELLAAAYIICNFRTFLRFNHILLEEQGETERNEKLRKDHKEYEELLKSTYPFRKAKKEMERLGRRARWFQAFGGPKSFRALLRESDMEPFYETLYEPLSLAVHAGNAIGAMTGKGIAGVPETEEYWYRPLRSPEEGSWLNLVRNVHRMFFLSTMHVTISYSPTSLPKMINFYDEQVFPRMRGSPLQHLIPESDLRRTLELALQKLADSASKT